MYMKYYYLPFDAALPVFGSNTSFAGSAHRRRTKLAVFLVAVTAGPLSRGTKTIYDFLSNVCNRYFSAVSSWLPT
jgi:hypothetical protein